MLRAVVLTQYRRVTDGRTDGQTDGWTDGIAVANTALAMRALRAKTVFSTRAAYLPIVDEVAVEWFRSTYCSRAVTPGRVKQHGTPVGAADDHRVRTAVVEVPRPRMWTVVGQRRTSWCDRLSVVTNHRVTGSLTDSFSLCTP